LRHTSTPLFGCVAVGAPAARAECVRLPRARGGVRPTPSQTPCLASSSLASTPPPRARSQAPARAWLPRKHTSVSFPSHHAAPGPSLNPIPLRTALPNPSRPPPACVLPPCPPQTPPSTSAMCCPSRPRRHWPHLALVRAPRPPAHLPHTHAPLPSSPALRPRHLLRVVVSVSRARRRRRALRGRPRRRRPPPAPPPPTTNRAAGSTPAARTPPTN